MRTEIEKLIAQGQLDKATLRLLDFVCDYAPELKADVIVLQSRLAELAKQEKRRRISAAEAQDQKITLGFEILDVLDELPSDTPNATGTSTNQNPVSQPSNTSSTGSHNNGQPIINITINNENKNENHINIQIENHVQALTEDIKSLKEELKKEAIPENKEAIEDVETLEQQLEGLVGAKTKDAVMPYIEKVQGFIQKVEKGNDIAAKAIQGTKKGAELLGKICKSYNEVAPWVGLPKVPPILIGG